MKGYVKVAAVCLYTHMHIMSHTHMTQLLLDKIVVYQHTTYSSIRLYDNSHITPHHIYIAQ